MTESNEQNITFEQGCEIAKSLQNEINNVLYGQKAVVDHVLVALIAGGHVLIEGVPGLGKTLLVRSLAKCISGKFTRVQFTPDLMPSDITGHAMYIIESKQFQIRRGPAFTNLFLADEINRAPAKTQAALLEVMQERQITIEGKSYPTGEPFMVLATQNPIEQEGTYPLPEAELDRFLMKIYIDYPSEEDEKILVRKNTEKTTSESFQLDSISSLIKSTTIIDLQRISGNITVDEQVMDYAVHIVRATRDWSGIAKGASPRGSLALVRTAKAHALLAGNNYVTPDDIKKIVLPVLRHRLILSADMEIEGIHVDRILNDILEQIPAPRL